MNRVASWIQGVRDHLIRTSFIVLAVILASIALISDMLAIDPLGSQLYPHLVSLAAFVLPSLIGALVPGLAWAIVLGLIPLGILVVVDTLVASELFLSPQAVFVIIGLLTVLAVLGWLARQALPDVLYSVQPKHDDDLHKSPSHLEPLHAAVIAGILLINSIALLYFELVAAPATWRLPFAFRPTPIIFTVLMLSALPLTVVLGMLTRRYAAATILAVLPLWLLIVTYLTLFAPSWYLYLEGLSDLAIRLLILIVLFAVVGGFGWGIRRIFR